MVSAARSIIQYIGNSLDDVILDALPLAFDYGLYQVLMSVMFGGTVVLEKSAGYVAPLIDRIEEEKVTGLPIVPSLSAMFLRLKRFPTKKLASLRYITNTGAFWPESHIRMFRDKLPNVKIFSMYGLTECKRVSFLPPELIDSHADAVGRAMPNCEAGVVDSEGRPVRPGETGELVVRGSNVMQGYWNDPGLTRQVFREGCWPADRRLHTGDLFRLGEDGFLYFIGRMDDLVKCSGRRVSPREVEEALTSIEGVAEAAALPVPDEISGNVMAAFVVVDKGKSIDASSLRSLLEQALEPYKLPKYVWILQSLPRMPNGKKDRKRLQGMAAELAHKGG
jgi:acyl-CoA synthetase (AMP-forming)/AMP-acid ligase II